MIRLPRALLALTLIVLLGTQVASAQTAPPLTLGYFDNGLTLQWQDPLRFHSLAKLIGGALGTAVRVVPIGRTADLEAGMKAGKFDLVAARQPHELALALTRHNYKFVANATDDTSCLIVTSDKLSIKTLKEIVGKRVVALPGSAQCTADLREAGIKVNALKITLVRDPDFIAQFLGTGLADVGIGLDSTTQPAKHWIARGKPVLHRTANKPYFPLVANPTITDEQIDAIRTVLTSMQANPDGAELLQSLGISGFRTDTEVRLRDIAREIEIAAE